MQVAAANGEVIITNDGATILQKMTVTQPAAKMLVELSKSQVRPPARTPRDRTWRLGTTAAVALAGEPGGRGTYRGRGYLRSQEGHGSRQAARVPCRSLPTLPAQRVTHNTTRTIRAPSVASSGCGTGVLTPGLVPVRPRTIPFHAPAQASCPIPTAPSSPPPHPAYPRCYLTRNLLSPTPLNPS